MAPVPRRLAQGIRRLLLHDVWRSLALLLGLLQVQILAWGLVVGRGHGLSRTALIGLSLAAMLANYWLTPILRRARGAGGFRRRAARVYMNLGIATLLVGLAVLVGWGILYPLAFGMTGLGLSSERAFEVFRVASGGLVAAVVGMFAWGVSLGRAGLDRSRIRVRLPGLHRELEGLRIAQISDLHIGNGLEGRRLQKLVEAVNELVPDVVVITGDIFDQDPEYIEEGAKCLAGLGAGAGVYAVLGNHDMYTGSERVASALAHWAPGIRLLRGEWVRLPLEHPLYLVGLDDPGRDWTARDLQVSGLETLAGTLPRDGPAVLLAHRPEFFHQASRLGLPLILAGHTHGGQIALPLPGGHLNPARLVTAFDRGLFRRAGSTLYVNRGVGTAGPRIRFNCRREIATIELAAAVDEDGGG